MINRFGWTRTTQASINFNVWRGRDSVRSELRFKRSNETLKHIRTWFQEIRRNTRQAIYARTLVRQTSSPSSMRAHIKDWLVISCLVGYSRGLTIYNLQCIERGNLHVGTGNWAGCFTPFCPPRGPQSRFGIPPKPIAFSLRCFRIFPISCSSIHRFMCSGILLPFFFCDYIYIHVHACIHIRFIYTFHE